ncbi:MAG TPA: hypothetical protein PLD14_02400 [Candidatus Pacearchaeota archaeon]|nr:hypothetical protein [Candidatus Pacearchaeota archaeon]HPR80052.1 hypothetical protein [Candidatus Pacearchaeota archaeon]
MQTYNVEEMPLIIIQGSFSNEEAVPKSLKMIIPETVTQSELRRSREGVGYMVDIRDGCSTTDLLSDIKKSGYELVDAFYQPRVNPKDPTHRSRYFMVRYTFARKENAEPSAEFLTKKTTIENDLQKLLSEAIWRIRFFLNPFFKDGKVIEGCQVASINLEARKPLFLPNGQSVVQWNRDQQGNKIGDAPEPIKAKTIFRVSESTISFAEA